MNRLLSNRFLRCLTAIGALAAVSGCYTVDLSDTTRPESRNNLRVGPGAREKELVRIVRVKRTHYSGRRVSFGLMPGIPCIANDIGGTGGCVPAAAMCLVVGPIVNAFALTIPTLCTLGVEPFTQTFDDRGFSYDAVALGFLGAYRWRVQPHDETEIEDVEDVLVDGGYRPDTAHMAVTRATDGTKAWHAYPGYAALVRDVECDGKVDVVFADGSMARRFRWSKRNPGCLAFEDRKIGK